MHPLKAIAETYLSEIQKQRAKTNSTQELSYRDYLGKFLRAATQALGRTADFTGEAKRSSLGRPDYTVTHGLKEIGHIEAEALGADLAHLKGHAKAQNDLFRDELHCFLQTNHLDFRLFVAKAPVATATLPVPPETGQFAVPDAALDALQALLERFLEQTTPKAATAEDLARQLAHRARILRENAGEDINGVDWPLLSLFYLYRKTLFAEITREKFVDVYAQTFTYGLFLAWLNTNKTPFDRPTALSAIPRAVPAVRVLLQFGGGDDLPEPLEWIVDGICADLDNANKDAATKHPAGIADPLIAFYGTFLAAYDPQLRERAGVYYTPDPVVDFLVRAVDDLLRRDFGKDAGLADESVRLLDPATGTATFLARAYRQVHETMTESGDAGLWPDRARGHVAKHFYGFERLPAAYTLAHVKLRQQLAELGVTLGDRDRLPVYLADTMMNSVPEQGQLPGEDILSREIRDAAKVRDQEEILVVLGNPPYFAKSDNPHKDSMGHLTFIGDLIESYKKVDGQPIKDKGGLKWIQDDYVKFIRFAQWRIDRSGKGIVAYITNHAYLYNPVFRGMRQQLLRSFDEIYILNLHGHSSNRERSPDGTKDENVFDITRGVAISVFVRRDKADIQPVDSTSKTAAIHYADVYGLREHKYDVLLTNALEDIEWEKVEPTSPFYFFEPQDKVIRGEYDRGRKISEIFSENGDPAPGIVTTQDQFAIAFTPEETKSKVRLLLASPSEQEARQHFRLCGQDQWNYANAKSALSIEPWQDQIEPIQYRPFDTRFTVYNSHVAVHRRERVMRHMLAGSNLGLVTARSNKSQTQDQFYCTRLIMETKCGEATTQSVLLPLYLYATEQERTFGMEERRANIVPAFITELQQRTGETPTPEDIFHYAYAVFHAPAYRTRYAAFLKTDFPRLPLPPDADAFRALAALGAKLTALHLLEDPALKQHGIAFPVSGDHRVKKMRREDRYAPPTPGGAPGRVKLNDTEYFENVPPEAWQFQVGGYQPAFKWLDDRKERQLTADDIGHYRRMIAAMRETAHLLPQLDAAFLPLLTPDPTAANTD